MELSSGVWIDKNKMQKNNHPKFSNKALAKIGNSHVLPSIKTLMSNKIESDLAKDIIKLDLSLSNIMSSKEIYSPKKNLKEKEQKVRNQHEKYRIEHGHILTMGIDHRGVSQVKDLLDGIHVAYGFTFLKFINGKARNSRINTMNGSKEKKRVTFDETGKNVSRELFDRHMKEI